ncbi:hypothetical protein N2W52_002089 [Clostridium perfringens]|nr:hypothetical protein [Clostridium perfringens]
MSNGTSYKNKMNKICKKYLVKFNQKELDKLNTIEVDNHRLSTMSVYAYLINLDNQGKLDCNPSIAKLHKMYKQHHKKFSLTTMKNRINFLELNGLIKINKEGKSNAYKLHRGFSFKIELTKKLTNKKPIRSVGITSLKLSLKNHKRINNFLYKYKKYIDIDIYTRAEEELTEKKEYTTPFYSAGMTKCSSRVKVGKRVYEIFNELKVKSEYIKEQVLNSILDRYDTITEKFLDKYIRTAIHNARIRYYQTWDNRLYKYLKKTQFATNVITSNGINNPLEVNFTQRQYSHEEYMEWEKQWQEAVWDGTALA